MEVALGLLVLVAVVCAGSALGRKLNVSVPLLLVLAGVAGSFLPFVPRIELNPELVLVGLLPPLLYAAALRTSLFDFGSNRRAIGLLSVGYVIFGTIAVGYVVWWLFPEIPLAAAMALGAVVAPPDAVAATAIARKVGMPRRIVTILEGESLVNDATALVCLRAAIAAIAGPCPPPKSPADSFSRPAAAWWSALAAAYVLTQLRKRIRNVAINTSTSLMAPFVAYLPAEAIHASGVLAVVVTGLVMGTKAPSMPNGAARLSQRSNWNTVQFLLENSVFLLIGLQVRTIIDGVQDDSLGAARIWAGCAVILLAVLLLRPVWVFPATYLPRLIPSVRRNDPAPPWQFAGNYFLGGHARGGDARRSAGAACGAGAPFRADPGCDGGGCRDADAAGLHAAATGPASADQGSRPARGRPEPGVPDAAGHRRRGGAPAGTAHGQRSAGGRGDAEAAYPGARAGGVGTARAGRRRKRPRPASATPSCGSPCWKRSGPRYWNCGGAASTPTRS